jgi:hypothetical protein
MFQYAGRIVRITDVKGNKYSLDIDNGVWTWQDWMFDPDYKPDEPLSPEDAIRAMLDGETLLDENDSSYRWLPKNRRFIQPISHSTVFVDVQDLPILYRRPEKRKRLQTPEEAKAWAESEASLGWMIRIGSQGWVFPRKLSYDCGIENYKRARLLPDLSGIDESTIEGFTVEYE